MTPRVIEVELEADFVDEGGAVWFCPLRLETLDSRVEAPVMEEVETTVEVAAGAADGKPELATSPRITAMRTAPPAPAITLRDSDNPRPFRRRSI